MRAKIGRRGKIAAVLLACLATGAALAAFIGVRNFRGASSELEADTPSAILNHPEDTGLATLQPVSFLSREGLKIAAWYVPSTNRAAVIIAHGSSSDRATMLYEIRSLANAGFGVLAFDWPGLGQSEGPVLWGSEARGALTAAIDWTSRRADVDRERIGGLGFSAGGFVMTQVAAADRRLRAIVLESTPSDFGAYVKLHFSKWGALSEWPARWALRRTDLFVAGNAPIKLIAAIAPRPLLIIAESDDATVPLWMTRELYETAREPKSLWIIHGAQHGRYSEAAGDEYARRLQAFFSTLYAGDSRKSPAP